MTDKEVIQLFIEFCRGAFNLHPEFKDGFPVDKLLQREFTFFIGGLVSTGDVELKGDNKELSDVG